MKESEENRKKELRRKEVLDFARRVGRHLSAQKKSEVLECEILRNERDINYFRYRIEAAQKRLDDKKRTIGEIEIRIAQWNDRLANIQPEKEAIEDKYHKLQKIQRDVDKRQALLDENSSLIRDLTLEIREKSEEYDSLKSMLQHDLARKKELEEDIDAYESTYARLEEEIGVMAVTRDMLDGKMPELVNIKEFSRLGKDNVTVEEYVQEVSGVIRKIENQISGIKAEIDKSNLEVASLCLQKESLAGKVERLAPYVSKGGDKGLLTSEVGALTQQRDSLVREIRMNREEIERIEPEIMELDQRLDIERKSESNYRERLIRLTETTRKLDEFENMETEFERLEKKIHTCQVDVDANSNFLDIISEVREHVEATNMSLNATVCDYDKAVNEHKLILLLSYNIYGG